MSEQIELKSGRILMLGTPPFGKAKRLFKAIANELKQVEIELESLDLKTLGGKDINAFKNAIMQLIGSDALEAAFWDCAVHSTLNSEKITERVFDPEDARSDYLPVVWEVIRHGLSPFFKNLSLSSLTPGNQSSNVPA